MALSPPEIFKGLLSQSSRLSTLVLGGIVVGPASEQQSSRYVIEISDRGWVKPELYAPIIKPRVNITVIGPELDVVDQIKNIIIEEFNYDLRASQRKIVAQSSDESFLVHTTWILVGPTQEAEGDVHSFQRERLVMAALIGTDPI